jgi:hypothetical protein
MQREKALGTFDKVIAESKLSKARSEACLQFKQDELSIKSF